jgi:Type IX secretion system protein PorV
MIKNVTHALRASLMLGLTMSAANVFAQVDRRIPTPAIASMIIAPDARSAAMGDAGVALSAADGDANSIFWNPGKLPFSGKDIGVAVSYTPWLRQLVNDMGLINASFYKKIKNNQVVGASINYFDQGLFQATDNNGNSLGNFNSKEYYIAVSYSRKLSEKLGLGVNLKYINSTLLSGLSTTASLSYNVQPASTVAADIGIFHTSKSATKWNYNWGVMIQNITGRVSYGGSESNFVPTNLKAGFAAIRTIDAHNKYTLTADINKLMIPTPTVDPVTKRPVQASTAIGGILGSFGDAPDGIGEELKEINLSLGGEYVYNDMFALRGGYHMESADKGGRNFFTAGFGVRLEKKYGLDFAYLIPAGGGNPLAQTLRLSLHANFNAAPKVIAN